MKQTQSDIHVSHSKFLTQRAVHSSHHVVKRMVWTSIRIANFSFQSEVKTSISSVTLLSCVLAWNRNMKNVCCLSERETEVNKTRNEYKKLCLKMKEASVFTVVTHYTMLEISAVYGTKRCTFNFQCRYSVELTTRNVNVVMETKTTKTQLRYMTFLA